MEYKHFSQIDLKDPFFDSLKADYAEFESWYLKKSSSNENAYVVQTRDGIQGFLYLKVENEEVNDVTPALPGLKRVKVGTLKVNPHGTRLGERFIKKIFDYATINDVAEIYVTVFEKHDALRKVFERYGFANHGVKTTPNGTEIVMLRKLRLLNNSVTESFPLIKLNGRQKYLLSVHPKYHSRLFPDSLLNSENYDIIQDVSHTNSIHKIYICFMDVAALKVGDQVVIYRTNDGQGAAYYRSVATSICTIEEIKTKRNFDNLKDYLNYCKDYSVFDETELRGFYTRANVFVIKMTYNAAFAKRLTRGHLISQVGLNAGSYWGFMKLTDDQFTDILSRGQVSESIIIN
jgi:L-amino acid N-acyltransferase YncA